MTENVLRMLRQERWRQNTLLAEGTIPFDLARPLEDNGKKLSVLLEEVGEVAKALNDREHPDALRTELVQVAACAVAWAEALV